MNKSINDKSKKEKKNNSVKQIFESAEEFIEENIFHDLKPKDDVDENKIYYNKFMTAIRKECKMIAFTGAYGVGKSSIINSILKKINNKSLQISLGNYNYNGFVNSNKNKFKTENEPVVDRDNPSNLEEKVPFDVDISDVETKIVQQILYTTDEKSLPNSRFKRIKFFSEKEKRKIGIIVFILLMLIYILFPITVEVMYINSFKTIHNVLSNILIFDINLSGLINTVSLVSSLIIFVIIYMFFYKLSLMISTKINITFFKYKNLEINIKPDVGSSVFNKYLDEIVYFFKETKHKILVIEDLDRYGNISLEIFRKLKELNFLLNSNETIKEHGGVIFICAIRDDLFSACEDRVKFFDYIIPIVSKFSSQNAKQYIFDLHSEFIEYYPKGGVKEKLLRIISFYIQDRRLLLNIFSEFKTYVDNLYENPEINYTELFALICYKNLNPSDFDDRLFFKGDLYNLFNDKNKLIGYINNELEEKNKNLLIEKEQIVQNRKIDSIDLKKAFVLSALSGNYINSNLDNVEITISNNKYTINEFINRVTPKELENNSVSVASRGYSRTTVDKNAQNDLIKKLNILNYDIDKQNKEIQKNLSLINNNLHKSVDEILNYENIENLIIDQNIKELFGNDLLIVLAKNGFIKENFEKSISHFKEGDLLPQDYKFIISVETNNKIEYKYKLNKIEEVINNIENKNFLGESILNFDIVNFLLVNKSRHKVKFEKLLEQFKILNSYRIDFLIAYMDNKENFNELLEYIISDEMLDYIVENIENTINLDKLIKFIIENISMSNKKISNMLLKEYIENTIDLINNIELTKLAEENLIYLELDLINYEVVSVDKINFFYSKGLYNANKSFYDRLLVASDSIQFNEKLLDILFGNDIYFDFREKCINSGNFNELYMNLEKFNSEEKNIVKALNSEELSIEVKKVIISKETEKIKDLRTINDDDVMLQIIESDKYLYTMFNIINCYDRIGNVNSTILNMLKSINQNYTYIKSENFDKFENDLLYSSGDVKIPYNKIAEEFSYCITSFDESRAINPALLVELIRLNKVELNIQTFTFLNRNSLPQLLELVNNNVNDLITIKNDIDISVEIINSILTSEANINQKLHFINITNINELSEEAIAIIVKEFIKNNIILDDILLKVIFGKLKENDKIEFFIYLHSQNEGNIKYLSMISEKTAKIRDGITTSQTFDKKYAKLLNHLGETNFINRVEEKKNGKINISYKKLKY